jgi:integrator complex subunit 6
MRANFLQPSIVNTKLVDDDSKHSLPISQMGNYQDYLKKMPVPLREIESTPVRQHMFGKNINFKEKQRVLLINVLAALVFNFFDVLKISTKY